MCARRNPFGLAARLRLALRTAPRLYPLFADTLRFVPGNVNLYDEALTHPSAVADDAGELAFERLEYLGDAVIELATSEYLIRHFPTIQEGDLTKLRARIVSREHLNRLAEDLGMDILIQHELSVRRLAPNLLGNAFEALFGAIFLDKGYEMAREVYHCEILALRVDWHEVLDHLDDAKSQLLNWGQQHHLTIQLTTETSEGHTANGRFLCTVRIEDRQYAQAYGRNKKLAERQACQLALEKIPTYSLAQPNSTSMEESLPLPH